MFNPLLDNLNNRIISYRGSYVEVPDGLQERYSRNGESVIRNWLWDVPGFRRWRVTRMDAGQKLQVLNSVAYPDFENDMPIMGIDLLWFGVKENLVAILDFQPLIQKDSYFEQYLQGLRKLQMSFPDFSNEKNMRSYDMNRYFSPWVIFCRGNMHQSEKILPSIFDQFITSYLDLHRESLNLNQILNPFEVHKYHCCYDIYNAEKDPAHGLFKSYFGKEWADSFVNEFLFPLRSY